MSIELAPVESSNPFARSRGEREGDWYSPRLHTLWVGAAGTSIFNATAHELSHVFVHAFTPYGLFLEELNYIQLNQVVNYCSYAAREDKIPFPVFKFAQEFRSSPDRFKKFIRGTDFGWLIDRYVTPWSHSWYLERILEGEALPSVLAANQEAAVKALKVCEDYAAEMLSDTDLFGSARIPAQAFPPVTPVKQGMFAEAFMSQACFDGSWLKTRVPVGAKHIFESHAQRFGQLHGGNDPEMQEMSLISKDFGHYYLWCWTMLVQEFQKLNGPIDSQQTFDRVMSTFWAMCDLALFTPVGVVYGRLRRETASWLDVHPGWRFMMALGKLGQVGWLSDLRQGFAEFQESICRLLNWPFPREFVELGTKLIEKNFLKYRDACRMRLEDPCPYMHPDLDRPEMVSFLADHMPIYWRSDKAELLVPGKDASESVHSIMQYFLPQYCWQIMMRDQLNLEEVLPRSLKVQSVFFNMENNEQLLKLIFEGVSVISPDNFVPLSQIDPHAQSLWDKVNPFARRR